MTLAHRISHGMNVIVIREHPVKYIAINNFAVCRLVVHNNNICLVGYYVGHVHDIIHASSSFERLYCSKLRYPGKDTASGRYKIMMDG